MLTARAGAEKYRSIQPDIRGNRREEVTPSALGIWIQEFHVGILDATPKAGNFRKIGGRHLTGAGSKRARGVPPPVGLRPVRALLDVNVLIALLDSDHALAVRHEGRLVTFDTGIPRAAVRKATTQKLLIL